MMAACCVCFGCPGAWRFSPRVSVCVCVCVCVCVVHSRYKHGYFWAGIFYTHPVLCATFVFASLRDVIMP